MAHVTTEVLRDLPKAVVVGGEVNCRSLRFATPDFLWTLVALADLMRLSLRERRTRGFVQCCVAGNPGSLRSHGKPGQAG
jgi:hypothetical protein